MKRVRGLKPGVVFETSSRILICVLTLLPDTYCKAEAGIWKDDVAESDAGTAMLPMAAADGMPL